MLNLLLSIEKYLDSKLRKNNEKFEELPNISEYSRDTLGRRAGGMNLAMNDKVICK